MHRSLAPAVVATWCQARRDETGSDPVEVSGRVQWIDTSQAPIVASAKMSAANVVWFDSTASLREIVAGARSKQADFVVLLHGPNMFAFRRDELVRFASSDSAARDRLSLVPSQASRVSVEGMRNASGPPPAPKGPPTSADRIVFIDYETRQPVRVYDPPRARSTPEAPLDDFASKWTSAPNTVTRHPTIDVSELASRAEVLIVVDLAIQPQTETQSDPIEFDNLPADWSALPVLVLVTSPQLTFEDGSAEGVILIRRDRGSVPCRLVGVRRPDAPGPLEVTATFFRNDRWCGVARQTLAVDAKADVRTLTLAECTVAPDLTVQIHRLAADRAQLVWTIVPATAHRHLIPRVGGETVVRADLEQYVRALFDRAAGSVPGEHMSLLQGIGERLWELAPRAFHDAYWRMRAALGDGFTIQFITDEPTIPWELIRPVGGDQPTKLLGETHPVARGLIDYGDRLRPTLSSSGMIVTIAPDYTKRSPPYAQLPAAREEADILSKQFLAHIAQPATARRLLDLLSDGAIVGIPLPLLHFAGHSQARRPIETSHIACEDGDVSIAQVRRQETMIGVRYHTFVVFNACEAGVTGDSLGAVGGWAEAFAYRDFGGFVAPLWAIADTPAKVAMECFFDAILSRGVPIGTALRDLRATHGQSSPTFLSYVYYGDVNARFVP